MNEGGYKCECDLMWLVVDAAVALLVTKGNGSLFADSSNARASEETEKSASFSNTVFRKMR